MLTQKTFSWYDEEKIVLPYEEEIGCGPTEIDRERSRRIAFFEKRGFKYCALDYFNRNSTGVDCPSGRFWRESEMEMMLRRPILGNRVQIEIMKAFEYLLLIEDRWEIFSDE